MKSVVIGIRNLSVKREKYILQDINWTVKTRENWVILGANGSGKTTLLNTIAGYMWPTKGQISVLGHVYGKADWRKLRESIGFVSTNILQRIDPDENVLETVVTGKEAVINIWKKPSTKDRQEALRILKSVECSALAKRKWRYLSQGERQRVLIGRALMANFKILVLDEPCAGLDPVARERFLNFINRLSKRTLSITIIFVTHHVEEITNCFTHILILGQGRIVASGAKDRVLNSFNLSKAFNSKIKIFEMKGRSYLQIKDRRHLTV